MTVLDERLDETTAAAVPALRCEHLTRRFGDRVAVDDVSLTVAPGETYGQVLFVFVTSSAGAAVLIDSRRLGVHDRMRAGPVAARSIVAGEGVSFLGIALLQSALIVGPATRAVGHAVPHAWAIDAWVEVLSKGGGVGSIVTELVVLSAFAAGLPALASLRLQRTLAS